MNLSDHAEPLPWSGTSYMLNRGRRVVRSGGNIDVTDADLGDPKPFGAGCWINMLSKTRPNFQSTAGEIPHRAARRGGSDCASPNSGFRTEYPKRGASRRCSRNLLKAEQSDSRSKRRHGFGVQSQGHTSTIIKGKSTFLAARGRGTELFIHPAAVPDPRDRAGARYASAGSCANCLFAGAGKNRHAGPHTRRQKERR